MIVWMRVILGMARPAVLLLFGLCSMVGLAQGGVANDPRLVAPAMVVIVAFVLFSVVLNDLADEAIDRVNLPGDHSRPLVVDAGSRGALVAVGVTCGSVALAGAAWVGWRALVVVAVGMVVSAAYSLPPLRVSARGGVASLLLPLLFVVVPYLVGLLGARTDLIFSDVLLMTGLYVGFIGRIVLKDFRDVKGDALFGKRTFVVRHGRRPTCAVAAVGYSLGAICLLGVRDLTPSLLVAQASCVVAVLALLRLLAREENPRREDRIISAIAILGRGMVMTVIAHLAMTDTGWSTVEVTVMTLAITVVVVGQASSMFRHGPRHRSGVPDSWVTSPETRVP
jgi:4-hydroxybenzoate polyprenyltransferase